MNNQTGPWTNEKHVRFLNSMEASFVQTMLENNRPRLLRLDRYLPDSSESTVDLKSQGRKKQAISANVAASRIRTDGRVDKRTRRPSAHHHNRHYYDTSQDQVVPQLEKRTGDKDEGDPPHVAGAPAN